MVTDGGDVGGQPGSGVRGWAGSVVLGETFNYAFVAEVRLTLVGQGGDGSGGGATLAELKELRVVGRVEGRFDTAANVFG